MEDQEWPGFLSGGGELGRLIRAHDWSTSPLRPSASWPQSLRSVVGLLLGSKFPMFVAWGEDLGFVYNDPYAEILGAKHPAALGARFPDIWAEIWSDISPLIDAAMTGEATYRENLPLLMNRKGFDEQTWFTFSYSPVRDESGQVAGMFCACTETTLQVLAKQRQAFRLALEERLGGLPDPRAVMDAAVEALVHYLGASRVGYTEVLENNRTTVSTSCYASGVEPLVGTFELDSFGPDSIARQRDGQVEVCDDVLADARQVHATWSIIDTRAFVSVPLIRNGRFRASLYVNFRTPHSWSADEVGLIEEVATRTWDAVERARAEQASRELNVTLEACITERTAELVKVQEVLAQSQKMEAVGQLTGGLAHDFNNLLAGISGSLELLQARLVQGRFGDLERFLSTAQGAAKRAAALTHRLLAFSRRQTLDPKPTDVNRLVTGMEELIRRTMGPAVEVEAVAAGGLWATLVDPNQLENALLNLCINARDAMPEGGRLTVETGNRWLDERAARERDLLPGQYVSLCVSDTGSGMTPEVIRRAFDPFFTTKPIGMGTGLGLSMVYGFARQSGGQARIYSEPGQGAMVCLYLPCQDGEIEDADGPGTLTTVPRAEQGETVLVIDDEPTVRMLVAEVLGDLGYTAIEAADGPAGLRVLQSNARIDLLVTDVGLPGGMNGRQVADAARERRPGLRVLFITGYAENAVLNHGHLDPGMHVMTKPFAMEALATRIKDLIAGT